MRTWTCMVNVAVKIAQAQACWKKRYSPKTKIMCQGQERYPCRLKGCERISLFEAMLSIEPKRSLYSGVEISKDRKGLGYWYVSMITIASLKSSLSLQKKKTEVARLKRMMKQSSLYTHPPPPPKPSRRIEEGGNPSQPGWAPRCQPRLRWRATAHIH